MATSILTALYLRASSKDQTESIPAQRDLLTRYAADHGLEIGPEYQDFAISGDSCSGRPGLQALLADAKLGKFQAVLVRQLSRLSRRDSLNWGSPFQPQQPWEVLLVLGGHSPPYTLCKHLRRWDFFSSLRWVAVKPQNERRHTQPRTA